MSLARGARLGPYEIVDSLGAGGMGEVYRARDTGLDRTVAIKILPAALAAEPQLRERFEREARAISSLNHPNICALYDVGHQAPSTDPAQAIDFLVLEYLEGETLADRLTHAWRRTTRCARRSKSAARSTGRIAPGSFIAISSLATSSWCGAEARRRRR
jgi:serine/threonine protein kinase